MAWTAEQFNGDDLVLLETRMSSKSGGAFFTSAYAGSLVCAQIVVIPFKTDPIDSCRIRDVYGVDLAQGLLNGVTSGAPAVSGGATTVLTLADLNGGTLGHGPYTIDVGNVPSAGTYFDVIVHGLLMR